MLNDNTILETYKHMGAWRRALTFRLESASDRGTWEKELEAFDSIHEKFKHALWDISASNPLRWMFAYNVARRLNFFRMSRQWREFDKLESTTKLLGTSRVEALLEGKALVTRQEAEAFAKDLGCHVDRLINTTHPKLVNLPDPQASYVYEMLSKHQAFGTEFTIDATPGPLGDLLAIKWGQVDKRFASFEIIDEGPARGYKFKYSYYDEDVVVQATSSEIKVFMDFRNFIHQFKSKGGTSNDNK